MKFKRGLAFAPALIALACSANEGNVASNGAGGSGGGEATGLCARLARAQCEAAATCCATAGGDVATCEASARSQCTDQVNLDILASDPITGFDSSQFEMTFSQYQSMAQNCTPGIAAFVVSVTGLRGSARGTRAAGETCDPTNLNDQNAIVAALASCADPATTACLPSETTWTCAPRSPADGPCYTDANCVDGLFCDNPGFRDIVGSVCVARKAPGQPCQMPNECASLSCNASGQCNMPGAAEYCVE